MSNYIGGLIVFFATYGTGVEAEHNFNLMDGTDFLLMDFSNFLLFSI